MESTDTSHLLDLIRELASTAASLTSLQEEIVKAIPRALPHYNWVGFYILDPAVPKHWFLDPSPVSRLRTGAFPFIRAYAAPRSPPPRPLSLTTSTAIGYLSCSIKTKSEIVVPIFADGNVVGELDIDSHPPAAFTDADRAFLEEAARIVGTYIHAKALSLGIFDRTVTQSRIESSV